MAECPSLHASIARLASAGTNPTTVHGASATEPDASTQRVLQKFEKDSYSAVEMTAIAFEGGATCAGVSESPPMANVATLSASVGGVAVGPPSSVCTVLGSVDIGSSGTSGDVVEGAAFVAGSD